jgi:signal transduction histidine kinase
VTIKLQGSEKELNIIVVDAGCGFSTNGEDGAPKGHYGIVGMRERMHRLGGRLELTSAPGAGTTVRLLVKREHASKAGEPTR